MALDKAYQIATHLRNAVARARGSNLHAAADRDAANDRDAELKRARSLLVDLDAALTVDDDADDDGAERPESVSAGSRIIRGPAHADDQQD